MLPGPAGGMFDSQWLDHLDPDGDDSTTWIIPYFATAHRGEQVLNYEIPWWSRREWASDPSYPWPFHSLPESGDRNAEQSPRLLAVSSCWFPTGSCYIFHQGIVIPKNPNRFVLRGWNMLKASTSFVFLRIACGISLADAPPEFPSFRPVSRVHE